MSNIPGYTRPPKVFISHAHSSPEHEQTIVNLVALLRTKGLDVVVDISFKTGDEPPADWISWMDCQIETADWVLMFFDETYRRRFDGREEPKKGLGGIYEGKIIKSLHYREGSTSKKFIPLLADGASSDLIPTVFFGPTRYHIPSQSEELARRLRPAKSAYEYPGLFELGGYQVPFIPTLNPDGDWNRTFELGNVAITLSSDIFKLPEEFSATKLEKSFDDLPGCRLDHHCLRGTKLEFTFSRTKYSDYLKSGEHLDDPLPNDPQRTFRHAFGQLAPKKDVSFRTFALTNICGVGVFIVTDDNYVLITRHKPNSHVYPRRWTFSASGTMRWGASPNPFTECLWKCREEINHQIDLTQLELVEVGADTRKLFFECCFVEFTKAKRRDIEELLESHPKKPEYKMLPLNPISEVVSMIAKECWEPAAEVTLLMLCLNSRGKRDKNSKSMTETRQIWKQETLDSLENFRHIWPQHQMLDEWDLRASKPGNLAVMSVRYPTNLLEQESINYVDKVIRFMRDDIKGKRVLEVGSGIGRITKHLVSICNEVTCIDLSERMHERNRQHLGADASRVRFETCFVQEFTTDQRFDVAVCSLVLIHNVAEDHFEKAVEVMCRNAEVVFVFEDVSARETSPHTKLKPTEALKNAFLKFDHELVLNENHPLFSDDIAFLKFVRKPALS